jgi:hypothetical protein
MGAAAILKAIKNGRKRSAKYGLIDVRQPLDGGRQWEQ